MSDAKEYKVHFKDWRDVTEEVTEGTFGCCDYTYEAVLPYVDVKITDVETGETQEYEDIGLYYHDGYSMFDLDFYPPSTLDFAAWCLRKTFLTDLEVTDEAHAFSLIRDIIDIYCSLVNSDSALDLYVGRDDDEESNYYVLNVTPEKGPGLYTVTFTQDKSAHDEDNTATFEHIPIPQSLDTQFLTLINGRDMWVDSKIDSDEKAMSVLEETAKLYKDVMISPQVDLT